ncbi:hypothetical protein IU433_12260 [Nocardia puris]|uniref:hypothetical protein n=1 Tax=Nocardia puris TaxID=208602 RepID=UPI001893CCF5|nr:hypothetical protein [Nocardia puris]MBF6459810.1 hypothetical protein [Nocardia puris]
MSDTPIPTDPPAAPAAPPSSAAAPAAPTPNDAAAAAASAPQPAEQTPNPAETVEFWKGKAREWETRSKANADKAKQFDEFQASQQTELERAQNEAQRLAGRADSFRDRAVLGEAKALAGDFANPEVAVRLLGDLRGYVDDDSGDIDTDRIKADLDTLLQREPYLARAQAPAGMRPNPAQGQSGAPALTPSQRAQEAARTGDWKAAGAAKSDLLLQLRDHTK